MEKRYTFFLFLLLLFTGISCSKDFLKDYEDRLTGGTWTLIDVDRLGGGSSGNHPFTDGSFVFDPSGSMVYTPPSGSPFSGSWNLRDSWVRDNCTTDDDGYRQCSDRQLRGLQLTAVNFTTQEIRTEYFDDIQFTSTNRFRAYKNAGSRTYVFYFRR